MSQGRGRHIDKICKPNETDSSWAGSLTSDVREEMGHGMLPSALDQAAAGFTAPVTASEAGTENGALQTGCASSC